MHIKNAIPLSSPPCTVAYASQTAWNSTMRRPHDCSSILDKHTAIYRHTYKHYEALSHLYTVS